MQERLRHDAHRAGVEEAQHDRLVIYGNQPGQEIEYPMAVVILGGLATPTLLNLFVLPALYLRVGRARAPGDRARTGWLRGRQAAS